MSICNSTPDSPDGSQAVSPVGLSRISRCTATSGTLAVIILVLKEGKKVASERMPAAPPQRQGAVVASISNLYPQILLQPLDSGVWNRGAPRRRWDTITNNVKGVEASFEGVRFLYYSPRGQSMSSGVSGLFYITGTRGDARPVLGGTRSFGDV